MRLLSSHHQKYAWVMIFIFAFDRLSKWWILNIYDLPAMGSVEILPFFNLTMVWNKGISMGLFQSDGNLGRYALIGLTAFITVVLITWFIKETATKALVGLALVIGGSVGNIWDRVQFGAVADFIHLHLNGVSFYVFNVADAAISLGVIFLLWDALLSPQKVSK